VLSRIGRRKLNLLLCSSLDTFPPLSSHHSLPRLPSSIRSRHKICSPSDPSLCNHHISAMSSNNPYPNIACPVSNSKNSCRNCRNRTCLYGISILTETSPYAGPSEKTNGHHNHRTCYASKMNPSFKDDLAEVRRKAGGVAWRGSKSERGLNGKSGRGRELNSARLQAREELMDSH